MNCTYKKSILPRENFSATCPLHKFTTRVGTILRESIRHVHRAEHHADLPLLRLPWGYQDGQDNHSEEGNWNHEGRLIITLQRCYCSYMLTLSIYFINVLEETIRNRTVSLMEPPWKYLVFTRGYVSWHYDWSSLRNAHLNERNFTETHMQSSCRSPSTNFSVVFVSFFDDMSRKR